MGINYYGDRYYFEKAQNGAIRKRDLRKKEEEKPETQAINKNKQMNVENYFDSLNFISIQNKYNINNKALNTVPAWSFLLGSSKDLASKIINNDLESIKGIDFDEKLKNISGFDIDKIENSVKNFFKELNLAISDEEIQALAQLIAATGMQEIDGLPQNRFNRMGTDKLVENFMLKLFFNVLNEKTEKPEESENLAETKEIPEKELNSLIEYLETTFPKAFTDEQKKELATKLYEKHNVAKDIKPENQNKKADEDTNDQNKINKNIFDKTIIIEGVEIPKYIPAKNSFIEEKYGTKDDKTPLINEKHMEFIKESMDTVPAWSFITNSAKDLATKVMDGNTQEIEGIDFNENLENISNFKLETIEGSVQRFFKELNLALSEKEMHALATLIAATGMQEIDGLPQNRFNRMGTDKLVENFMLKLLFNVLNEKAEESKESTETKEISEKKLNALIEYLENTFPKAFTDEQKKELATKLYEKHYTK